MMKTAKEFWEEKFDEEPETDAQKLAVTMMREYADYFSSQLETLVMPKIADDEKDLLSKLIKSKIGEIRAHIVDGESIDQRMGKVKLIDGLNNLHKKLC